MAVKLTTVAPKDRVLFSLTPLTLWSDVMKRTMVCGNNCCSKFVKIALGEKTMCLGYTFGSIDEIVLERIR